MRSWEALAQDMTQTHRMLIAIKVMAAILAGLLFLGLCLIVSVAQAEQADLDYMGLDYVKKSLNKRVVITPRRSWTEHTGGNTGVDYRTIVVPPKQRRSYENRKHFEDCAGSQYRVATTCDALFGGR